MSSTDQEAGLWGWNLTLLIACTITLWAVLGELGALGLLSWELVGGGTVGDLLLAVIGLVALLGIYYFWTSVSPLVTKDREPVVAAVAQQLAAVPSDPQPRQHWTLL